MYTITIVEKKEVTKVQQGEWVALETVKNADGSEKTPRGYAPDREKTTVVERIVLEHEMDTIDLPGIVNALYGQKAVKA